MYEKQNDKINEAFFLLLICFYQEEKPNEWDIFSPGSSGSLVWQMREKKEKKCQNT